MKKETYFVKIYPFACKGMINLAAGEKQVEYRGLIKVDVPEDLVAFPSSVLGQKWSEVLSDNLDKIYPNFCATADGVKFIKKKEIVDTLNNVSFGAFGNVQDIEISFYNEKQIGKSKTAPDAVKDSFPFDKHPLSNGQKDSDSTDGKELN